MSKKTTNQDAEMQKMNILYQATSEIKPYDRNPRLNDSAVDAVAKSIQQFGFRVPIVVDADNVIVAGHTRWKAAQQLGLREVPTVSAADLTPAQVRAFRIADNSTAGLAEWDPELLADEVAQLPEFDFADFGLVLDDERGEEIPAEEVPTTEYDAEAKRQSIQDPQTKRGDVYRLGDHVLMCGDSTEADDVDRLLSTGGGGREEVDMVFTDPPYALFGNSTGVSGVGDASITGPFFHSFAKQIVRVLRMMGHVYISCDWHSCVAVNQAMEPLVAKNLIVWQKSEGGGLGSYYSGVYELIWFFINEPKRNITLRSKVKSRTIHGQCNIWKIPIVQTADRVHNAQKPLELVEKAVLNSSDKGGVVLDLFGGSGTTLIACEETGRRCRMMELDPGYCDVIIDRWEQHTGKQAEKLRL